MKSEPDDINELVEALRQDLPTARDAARVRARLAGFGVALGAGITTTEALAGTLGAKGASAGGAGLWSQFGALSLGAKLGVVAAVSVSAVTGPLIVANMDSKSAPAPVASAAPKVPALPRGQPAPHSVEPEATAIAAPPAPMATALAAEPSVTATAPPQVVERVRTTHAELARVEPALAEAVTPPSTGTAPALLPAAPPPVEEEASSAVPATALGEETRLIDAAFSALRAGDHDAAAGFVREHERRFPNGMLSRERERARAALLERR